MYSSLWYAAVLLVRHTLGPEFMLSVAVYWGTVQQRLLKYPFAPLNLGLERDPQPPHDLNMYQMEQIQKGFSALLGSAVSLCFLALYPALQLTSLFCRKVSAGCHWLPGPCRTGGFSCTCVILSTGVVWSIWHRLLSERGCWVNWAAGTESLPVFLCGLTFLSLAGCSCVRGFAVCTSALVVIWGCDCLQAHEYLIWKDSSAAAEERLGFTQVNSISPCWFCQFLA